MARVKCQPSGWHFTLAIQDYLTDEFAAFVVQYELGAKQVWTTLATPGIGAMAEVAIHAVPGTSTVQNFFSNRRSLRVSSRADKSGCCRGTRCAASAATPAGTGCWGLGRRGLGSQGLGKQ